MNIGQDTDKNNHVLHIKSLSDFKRIYDNTKQHIYDRNLSHDKKGDWHGTKSMEDMLDKFHTGFNDIIGKIKKETRDIKSNLDEEFDTNIQYNFDVIGQFFDIGVVISGEPECWLYPEEVENNRYMEINITNGFPDGSDIDKVIKNASIVLAVIQKIEDSGVRVKLNIVSKARKIIIDDSNSSLEVIAVAKDYGDVIDFRTMSVMVHPSWFRRCFVRIIELVTDGECNPSYGIPLREYPSLINDSEIKEWKEKVLC